MSFENKYPYTDFHELNLDWFLKEFKIVHDHVDDLDATVQQFTEFVTNYFENLDVQEEINNKLNAMTESGELGRIIQAYIPDEVTSWMDEHIQPTTPPVDDTLSIEGAAADAKKTGTLIGELEEYNTINFLYDSDTLGSHTTAAGITFNFHDGGCEVTGFATASTFQYFYRDTAAFPAHMHPGGTYYIEFEGENVYFEVYYYKDSYVNIVQTLHNASFTIPEDATGINYRLMCKKNAVVNEFVNFKMFNAMPTPEITLAVADIQDALSIRMKSGNIEAGTDLNTVLNSGMYYIGVEALASVTNIPSDADTSEGADVIVSNPINGVASALHQYFISQADGAIFYRRYHGGAEGQWEAWSHDKSNMKTGNIEGSTDFNTLLTSGVYYIGATAFGTATNIPSGIDTTEGADVIVSNPINEVASALHQIIFNHADGNIYFRRYSGGGGGSWGAWNHNKTIMKTGNVEAGTDMNDMLTSGVYYIGRTALNAAINAPENMDTYWGAELIVSNPVNEVASALHQILITMNDGIVYRRRFAGGSQGTWSLWVSDKNSDDGYTGLYATTDRMITDNMNGNNIRRISGNGALDLQADLTFEQGGINSSGVEVTSDYYIRTDYIATDEGDSFFTQYDSPDMEYRIRYYFYDTEQTFIGYSTTYSAFSGDIDDQAYITVGAGYIRFVVHKVPADSEQIVPADIANVDFSMQRQSYRNAEIIRIATHNVRNWGTEHNYGYRGNYEKNMKFYRKLYGDAAPSVLGLQEYAPFLDADHEHYAAGLFRNLFMKYYNSINPRDTVLSNYIIDGYEAKASSSGRKYEVGYIENANGTPIKIINFHAYPGTSAEAIAYRAAEYADLITEAGNDPCIIMGDLNTMSLTELEPFTTAGFKLANGGDFGTFLTCTSAGQLYPTDNIIVSPDLTIKAVSMAESFGTSDHKLLYADIMI